MRHVPFADFENRASEIAAAIEEGEEVVLTRDGQDYAKVVRMADDRLARHRAAIEGMIAVREELRAKGVRVSSDEIREWINEGRR